MGRPSMAAQRSDEILEAFERCVGKYGLAGSSLECIAAEAGGKRSILRHYVGNREDLVLALGERVVGRYRDQLSVMEALRTVNGRIDRLLGYLIPRKPDGSTEDLLVMEALIGAAHEHDELRDMPNAYINDLTNHVADVLRCDSFEATQKKCWSVAYGLISICFNHESLMPLLLPSKYRRSARECCQRLIDSLTAGNR